MLEGVVVELLLTNGGIGLLDKRIGLFVHVRVRDGSGGMHE